MAGLMPASGSSGAGSRRLQTERLARRTALMHEPYTHQPQDTGIAMADFQELGELIGNASEACLQVLACAALAVQHM